MNRSVRRNQLTTSVGRERGREREGERRKEREWERKLDEREGVGWQKKSATIFDYEKRYTKESLVSESFWIKENEREREKGRERKKREKIEWERKRKKRKILWMCWLSCEWIFFVPNTDFQLILMKHFLWGRESERKRERKKEKEKEKCQLKIFIVS